MKHSRKSKLGKKVKTRSASAQFRGESFSLTLLKRAMERERCARFAEAGGLSRKARRVHSPELAGVRLSTYFAATAIAVYPAS